MQVMYEPSELGVPIKRDTTVVLGIWHSYKMACTKVHECFANLVFGPFYHALAPREKFNPRPRFLSAIETLFMYLFIGYKAIRLPLRRLLHGGH